MQSRFTNVQIEPPPSSPRTGPCWMLSPSLFLCCTVRLASAELTCLTPRPETTSPAKIWGSRVPVTQYQYQRTLYHMYAILKSIKCHLYETCIERGLAESGRSHVAIATPQRPCEGKKDLLPCGTRTVHKPAELGWRLGVTACLSGEALTAHSELQPSWTASDPGRTGARLGVPHTTYIASEEARRPTRRGWAHGQNGCKWTQGRHEWEHFLACGAPSRWTVQFAMRDIETVA